MRVIVVLTALIVILAWLGFEQRNRNKDVASVLMAVAGLLAVMLIGAFFGLY